MKKNSTLPLSLVVITLLIVQQLFTLRAPAQTIPAVRLTGLPMQTFQSRSLAASNVETKRDVSSAIFDAVILDYDHPPFPRGTKIPEFGIKGGRIAQPEAGCAFRHYHSDPTVPNVRICRVVTGAGIRLASIIEEGPYRDQNPQGCGHGRVEKTQAALEIVVQGPTRAARRSTINYIIKVKNVGEIDFDKGTVRINLSLDGSPFPFPGLIPLNAALRVGQEEEVPGKLDLRALEEDEDFGGRFNLVEVDIAALGFLKDCREEVAQVAPSVKLTTNIIDADTGPKPDFKREFGFNLDSTDEKFAVMPVHSEGMSTGLALLKDGKLSLLRGDSKGGFAPGIDLPVQGLIDNALVSDINNDSDSDIVVVNNQSRNLLALLRDSSGGFQSMRTSSIQINFDNVAAGDVDGDNSPDIVGADATGMMQVMRGDGQGGFTSLFTINTGLTRIDTVVVANYNGDANSGVVVANYNGEPVSGASGSTEFEVFLNVGTASPAPPQFYSLSGKASWVTAGDVNGDDKDEIITTYSDSNTINIIDAGNGTVINSFSSGGLDPVHIQAGDINGDDKLDLVVANQGSSTVSIFLGDGSGDFFNFLNIDTPRPSTTCFGDFDGDGNIDGQDLIVFRRLLDSSPPPFVDNLHAEADSDAAAITVYLNDDEPVTRAFVEQVEIKGKHLIVTCTGCASGAKVLVDGVQIKKTIVQPDGRLRGKKAAKPIRAGQTVVVQVESEGKFSEWFIFHRPD